jgi:ADP-heptose:LPS heptosyltransferase
MKRWPEERFVRLAAALSREGFRVLRFLEPRAIPEEGGGWVRAPLRPLKGLLSRCAALVTNDSGIMHVGVGLGVPVVAVFGSTSVELGFGPLGPRDRVVERDLACRPCGVHGARFCWQGHATCLRGVGVAEVRAALHGVTA